VPSRVYIHKFNSFDCLNSGNFLIEILELFFWLTLGTISNEERGKKHAGGKIFDFGIFVFGPENVWRKN
jgi:hypothetical protein